MKSLFPPRFKLFLIETCLYFERKKKAMEKRVLATKIVHWIQSFKEGERGTNICWESTVSVQVPDASSFNPVGNLSCRGVSLFHGHTV